MNGDLVELLQEFKKLQVEQLNILEKQELLIERIESHLYNTSKEEVQGQQEGYTQGDHVYITNPITHVVGRWVNLRDRTGTITDLSFDSQGRRWATIHTFSGRRGIRRLVRNLRPVTDQEKRVLRI